MFSVIKWNKNCVNDNQILTCLPPPAATSFPAVCRPYHRVPVTLPQYKGYVTLLEHGKFT